MAAKTDTGDELYDLQRMPRPRKTVYERMCPACRKLLRTRPREVAQAAILHIQINAYAEQARKARQKKR